MLVRAEIRFTRPHFEDAFGFSCMKAAYSHFVKGKMEYSIAKGVFMIIEGNSKQVYEFLEWLNQASTGIDKLHMYLHELKALNFKEFDIYQEA
jgi:hypothetical protein